MFWLPRVPSYRIAASGAASTSGVPAWICGIRHRVIGAENIPDDAAHRDVEAQLDVGDARAPHGTSRRSRSSPRRSCCRSRSSAGGSRSPRRSPSTARPAPTRCSRWWRRAASGSARASGSSSTRKARGSGPARARSTRRAARGSRSALGVPILPVAHNAGYLWPKGVLRQAAGDGDDVDRPADPAGGQGRRRHSHRGSRDLDRDRSRAPRSSAMRRPTASGRRARSRRRCGTRRGRSCVCATSSAAVRLVARAGRGTSCSRAAASITG